jgi:MAATS-type transcriptional repressor, C-terminal region
MVDQEVNREPTSDIGIALAASIKRAISEGTIRADIDAQRHAVMILGLLRSLITMWLIDPRSVPLDQISEKLVTSLKRELIGSAE